jgi:hypothetical protein
MKRSTGWSPDADPPCTRIRRPVPRNSSGMMALPPGHPRGRHAEHVIENGTDIACDVGWLAASWGRDVAEEGKSHAAGGETMVGPGRRLRIPSIPH